LSDIYREIDRNLTVVRAVDPVIASEPATAMTVNVVSQHDGLTLAMTAFV